MAGTDSHTTMIDGLGVVGWGVGRIEAEATIFGQRLMTSWAVVCDVWWLEPQNLKPGETPIKFTQRVTDIILVGSVIYDCHVMFQLIMNPDVAQMFLNSLMFLPIPTNTKGNQ
ncbi:hypothetical protein JHK84_031424 [Glycine max]|nr:hypothetical protein JHK84_031424 [Glycine max]